LKKRKLIAGNWKMNLTFQESLDLVSKINECQFNNIDVKVAPAFTYLQKLSDYLSSSKIEVIAQNIHHEIRGAYTGEISCEMLKSIDINTVIIGHSERRNIFNESAAIVSNKINSATKNSMNVIYCIGEHLVHRESDKHFEVIKSQIENEVFSLNENDFSKITIAYEPVWAIGTGKTANTNQIQSMHKYIRDLIKIRYSADVSKRLRILYGGSVKPSNASEIFSLDDVDGALIGGASLNAEDFLEILNISNE
jgi:triosephosphate isomerase